MALEKIWATAVVTLIKNCAFFHILGSPSSYMTLHEEFLFLFYFSAPHPSIRNILKAFYIGLYIYNRWRFNCALGKADV
jgi:hypothetical protein